MDKKFTIKTGIYIVFNIVVIVLIRSNSAIKEFARKASTAILFLFFISFVLSVSITSRNNDKHHRLEEYAFASRFYILLLMPILIAALID